MRLQAFSAFLLACLGLSACTTGAGIEALKGVGPSNEKTSSIVRPDAAVPSVEAAIAEDAEEQLAQAGVTALAETAASQATVIEKVVLGAPPVPLLRPRVKQPQQTIYKRRFRDAHPINFGPAGPERHAVHGVDVSRWQRDIDWVKLRTQGANFAYIKATDGGDHVDPMFRTNWRGAAEAGIRRGAYHFFYWCRDAASQADWFIRNVPKVPDALPPVLDVEWNHQSACRQNLSPQKVIAKMKVFLDKLELHYGQRPVIYTAPDFYADNLKGAFTDYPFWLRAVAEHPSKVYPGRKWVFWQYSGSGLSHGVDGRIDLNVFHGSEREWHAWVKDVTG